MRERSRVHLERSAVLALAPLGLQNHRELRYRGDDQAVPLASFVEEDQASLGKLYAFLLALEEAAADREQLDAFLRDHDIDKLTAQIVKIGRLRNYDATVAAAAHDLRGGVLSALLLELGAASLERLPVGSVWSLTRDCLKQMRNLLADLDPPARSRDQGLRYHSLTDLVSALRNYQGSAKSGRVTLHVDAEQSATIAASCTEFGTIERVVFNLLENAAVHTSSREIEASLITIEQHLRVAVMNALTDEDSHRLRDLLASNRALLYSSFSSTGSGIGLQVAAELVGRAYGIETLAELVDGGYIGTSVTEHAFVSWFHWPLAARSPGDPSADCACR